MSVYKKTRDVRVVLLDAHAIIHRAYHAMPDFQSRDGTPTGGLYGICLMLIKSIEDLQPDHIIACYDLPKPTFRHAAYDDYKAGRREADEPLVAQIQSSRDIFHAFSIPIYEMEGYEADDLLGTFAEILKQDPGTEVIIASGDMDTLQLVDTDQVRVYTPKKGLGETILYDEDAVVARYGFGSDLIPDYKGLAGDSSDNIPGIKGIGDKAATQVVQTFGTVENMYEAIDKNADVLSEKEFKTRAASLLIDGRDDALFSKELATIKRDVPIEFALPECCFTDGLDLARVGELFRKLEFRTMMDKLKKVLPKDKVSGGGSGGIGAAGAATDSAAAGIDPAALARAKLSVYLVNPVVSDPTIDDILTYADADGSIESAIINLAAEIKNQNLQFVLDEIEASILPVVDSINTNGFLLDKTYLEKLSKDFGKDIKKLESGIHKLVGREFNIKSTQQLSVALFEDLGLPTKGIKKTPKGVLSTKESELEKLAGQHEIIEHILEYRELTKLTSTYIDNIIPMIDESTGRLYATLVQTGTTTGRMSSKDPNLQNIPTSTERGRMIRQAFIAPQGSVIVSADYSQIELRMAAQLSGDQKFIDVFTAGDDIHTAVATELFGSAEGENRRRAKVINFGILYGMGANALRKNLGGETTLAEARDYLEQYFAQFPTLAGYLESTKESVRQNGYSETLFGRRRFFPDITSKIPFIRAAAERMAINAPIQGTATADIIKLAMRDIWDYLETQSLHDDIKILSQVHDELVFEVTEKALDRVPELEKIMENVLEKYAPQVNQKPLVPLVVDSSHGPNWAEAK